MPFLKFFKIDLGFILYYPKKKIIWRENLGLHFGVDEKYYTN